MKNYVGFEPEPKGSRASTDWRMYDRDRMVRTPMAWQCPQDPMIVEKEPE